MKAYRVKLNKINSAKENQNNKGYLSFGAEMGKFRGSECIYSRGEALKKARMFGGKIEKVALGEVFKLKTIVEIPNNSLIYGVELLLEKQPQENGMYKGDVFFTLLAITDEMTNKVRLQLCELV